ncbi:MAG: 2-isopropylmalate synthase [Clostridia bacterium]|nr:2-isopropylmalate synthase [Clostridia bacterium]
MSKIWKNDNWLVSEYNFKHDGITKKIAKNFKIHDATLRDGEQTPGVVFRKDEKVEIARLLSEAGIHRIEAGMPAVSKDDRDAIEEIKKRGYKSEILAFARATIGDIELCNDCGVDGVVIEVPIGKPKLENQFGWTVDNVIEKSLKTIERAKQLGLYTVFFPYDTTRADEDDLTKLISAVTANVCPDSIGIVDTMGCVNRIGLDYLMNKFKSECDLELEFHTHNDFGLGVANSIHAILNGFNTVHGCVNGMGERTGNASIEEIVAVMKMLYGVDLGIDLRKLIEACDFVQKASGFKLAVNKPILGTANYIRESGIGVECLFNSPLTMFATNPSYYGKSSKMVLGKKSGIASIEIVLKDNNIILDDLDKKKAILADVKQFGTDMKRNVTNEEFLEILKKYI